MMDGGLHTWLIDGKPVTPYDDEDVFRLIREHMGEDAEEWVRYNTSSEVLKDAMYNMTDNDLLREGFCSGECDRVQETQQHYEDILHDIDEIVMEVYKKIVDGQKRSKTEQFALDKVIAIHNLIQKNT